jgi:hypothetical protein
MCLVKRLPIVCLLLLLSLILATSAFASPRATNDHPRAQVAKSPDWAIYGPDAQKEAPALDTSRANEPAQKASPVNREIAPNQEIGDGKCFEYVIFEIWHIWVGCGTGGGGGGGW